MGIRLEYVPSSPPVKPPPLASFAPSDDETGRSESGLHRLPRRRHSNASLPGERLSLLSDEATYDLAARPRSRPQSRSVSFLDHHIAPRDALALSRGAPGGDDLLFPPRRLAEPRAPPKETAAQGEHVPDRASNWNHFTDSEDGELEDATDSDALRHIRPPTPRQKAADIPHGIAAVGGHAGLSASGASKEQPASPASHEDTDLIRPPPQSDDALAAARGAGATTAQAQGNHLPTRPQRERPVVDFEALEAKLAQIRAQEDQDLVKDVSHAWHRIALEARRRNAELGSVAVEYDNNDLLGEVLDIWQEEAFAVQQRKLEAEAAAKHEAYVARMEKRATRVYEIFTIRNVLAHWQDLAQEEVDRTAVARRHLVRKRAFEGWRAQHVRDESKVRNFILEHALQKWSQIALHHEVRREVAVQWYRQQLCKQSLRTMWEESKRRLADEFYACNLARDCLDTWAERARDTRGEYAVAVALDERLLLDEAVNIWLDEVEDLRYNAYTCTRQFLVLGCRKDLAFWQEQAKLTGLLRRFSAAYEEDVKRQTLETWHAVFAEARRNGELADAFLLQDPVDHWEREMKLKLFLEREAEETKIAVLNRWCLEERLAWYKRHLDTRTKRQTLNTLLAAARQARSKRVRHEEEADYVDSYYTQTEVVDVWLAETDKMWTHRHNADLVSLYRTTKPCLDRWRERYHEAVARGAYYRRLADRHRNRSIVAGVLDAWPALAETARRERMMTSLRQFRRRYKVELALSCMNKWLAATADAVDAGRDAYNASLRYEQDDVNDCLEFWSYTARRAQNIRQIAADAELEVYCGKWQDQLHEVQENMQDAVEYDAEQTRARCWERWEFQTLQQQSKGHMAATVQDRNDKRLCRQILDEWLQKAVPEAAPRVDPRQSTISRRSIRQQLARSSVSGLYTASQLATLPSSSSSYHPYGSLSRGPSHQRPTYPETPQVTVSQLGRSNSSRRSVATGARFAARSSTAAAAATNTTTTTTAAAAAPAPTFRSSLGPMDEFDDESLGPDVETNDPGFMSTPTKWTGSARPLGYRPGALAVSSSKATTTPSAILPSPYERELRRRYGASTTSLGGGGGGGGGGLLRQQQRVEFADISENSAEELYG